MRRRWLGATGVQVPEIALEGDPAVPLSDAVVLDDVADVRRLEDLHARGVPVVVRASTADEVKRALSRPEVAAVLVPRTARRLLDLDLTELTYG